MYGNEDRAQQAEPSTAKFKPDRDFSGVDRFVCLLQSSFLILSALCVYYILRCLIFRLLTSKQVEEKCCAQRARRVREERRSVRPRRVPAGREDGQAQRRGQGPRSRSRNARRQGRETAQVSARLCCSHVGNESIRLGTKEGNFHVRCVTIKLHVTYHWTNTHCEKPPPVFFFEVLSRTLRRKTVDHLRSNMPQAFLSPRRRSAASKPHAAQEVRCQRAAVEPATQRDG